jgi:hypothetical protein
MAWNYVNSGHADYSSSSNTTLTYTLPWTVTAGNLLVVNVFSYLQTSISVQDSVNNSAYTFIATGGSASGGRDVSMLWYVPPIGGSSFPITATVASSSTPTIAMIVFEFSYGGGTVSVPSASYSSLTTGTVITLPGNLTPTGSDLIMFSARAGSGTWTSMSSPAFTMPYSSSTYAAEYLANYSSPVNPTLTTTVSSYSGGVGAVFHASAASQGSSSAALLACM